MWQSFSTLMLKLNALLWCCWRRRLRKSVILVGWLINFLFYSADICAYPFVYRFDTMMLAAVDGQFAKSVINDVGCCRCIAWPRLRQLPSLTWTCMHMRSCQFSQIFLFAFWCIICLGCMFCLPKWVSGREFYLIFFQLQLFCYPFSFSEM